MLVLWIALTALGFAVVVLAVLGFGLFGQVKRLLRAAEEARADVEPRIEVLRGQPSTGRHRA